MSDKHLAGYKFATIFRQLQRLCFVLAPSILISPNIAADEESDALWSAGLFHISVSGVQRSGSDIQNFAATRTGKAFAIGPNHVVTARHILGSRDDWELSDKTANTNPRPLRQSELRVHKPIVRTVELFRKTDLSENNVENFVLPSPSVEIDAIGILVPGLQIERYFQLSFCGLRQQDEYYAVLSVSDNPEDKNSVKKVEEFKLSPEGYRPLEFGGLYVFEAADLDITHNSWGHAGSPILDADGFVVALVSAIVRADSETLILATPIQPRTPGATNVLSLDSTESQGLRGRSKCSLSNTVGKIHDQMSQHATWNLKLERDDDGKPKDDLVLEYESIAEDPNIDSIEIEYNFYGKRDNDLPKIDRISFPGGGENVVTLNHEERPEERIFRTDIIFNKGTHVLEKWLDEKDQDGYISYVELSILPVYRKGDQSVVNGRNSQRVKRKYVVREIKWQVN